MQPTDQLDERLRSIVFGLVDSAPPAPPFPDPARVEPRRRQRRRRRAWVVAPIVVALIGGSAAAAVPALLQTSPGVQRLFIRTAPSGVDIRAYLFAGGGSVPTAFQGELSTSRAMGILSVDQAPVGAINDFAALVATEFGTGADRALAVAVRTGTGVALVRATFSDGRQDEMRPIAGWAVLAERGARPGGTVVAYNSAGARLGSTSIPPPSPSGEGFVGESVATFARITNQGIIVIGHLVADAAGGQRWVYPYLADKAAVQLGIEGVPACQPQGEDAIDVSVAIVGVREGEPMTVLIVYAGRAIARVMVTYVNGANDAMGPVAGEAVLANVGTIAKNGALDTMKSGTIEGFDKAGRLVKRERLSPLGAGGTCL